MERTPKQKGMAIIGCATPSAAIHWAGLRASTTLPYDVGSLKIS